jgi:endoglycosylceramidase
MITKTLFKKAQITLLTLLSLLFISAHALPVLTASNYHFVTADGRIVILHGVNEMNKISPYEPSAIGFNETNIAFLKTHGFNIIRLGVFWAAIEPTPNHYDDNYLKNILQTVKLLERYGIYTLIDFHQDAYSLKHGGAGFPTWAALAEINYNNIGFPANGFGGAFIKGQIVPDQLDQDSDHFWNNDPLPNGTGLQDQYAAMVNHVVKYFKDNSSIVGYDLMNEPFPGSLWKTCTNKKIFIGIPLNFSNGCKAFDSKQLAPFYNKIIATVHQADSNAIIFYEPSVFYGIDAPTFLPKLHGENLAFNFHHYNIISPNIPFENAQSQMTLNHATLFMSEFDAKNLNPKQLNRLLTMADQYQLSWTDWAYTNNPGYKFYAPVGQTPEDPKKQGIVYDMRQPLTGNNVEWDRLNAITRPYPQMVAGKIINYQYNLAAKKFELTYLASPNVRGNSDKTQIFIPLQNFPAGYSVELIGVTQLSNQDPQLLIFKNIPGSKIARIEIDG